MTDVIDPLHPHEAAPAAVSDDLQRLDELVVAHPLCEADLDLVRRAQPLLRVTPVDASDWHAAAPRARALLTGPWSPPIDEWLDHAPGLRWVHTVSAGVDRLLTPRSRPRLIERGIVLTNSRGVHAVPIAEHVLGLMLAFARGLPRLIDAQRESRWTPQPFSGTFELHGQTLAVIGQGAIGTELSARAAALGLEVRGVRRQADAASGAVGLDALDAVLAEADHVAVCLPLTDATRGLFDEARLRRIRRGAYLYNIGRGALVDGPALQRVLEDGHLAGAGLDVTDPEPLPAHSPLWRLPQVLITSHSSAASPRNARRALDILIDNLGRARSGQPLRNRVDPSRGY